MCRILKLQKQYQFIVILLIMIINKIQEYYILLFQINCLVAYQKFLQQIISFTFNSEYDETKYVLQMFTDQNSQALKIGDRIDLTMVIKQNIYYMVKSSSCFATYKNKIFN